MKKTLLLYLTLILIFSCNKKEPKKNIIVDEVEYKHHMEIHKEMDKIGNEHEKFNKELTNLYFNSEKNPDKIISKADSLLKLNEIEKDKYKSRIKETVKYQLHYLKAEIFYKKGEYQKSLHELSLDNKYGFIQGDKACAYASNYVKLKQFEKAKSFVDSIGKSYYIYDYALANYYECIGNKTSAVKIYNEIKQDKSIKHYAYYKLAVNRLEKLKNSNSQLLNEIYFPTGNPNFEIADSDYENRNHIFKLMEKLPENQTWAGTEIIESPQENDKNYYWVKVINQQKKEFNYYIYEKTFEIKYFDVKQNKIMTLKEWRKKKNGI